MYNSISLFNVGARPRTHMDPHDHCCRACQASLQWQTVMAVLQDLCPDLGAYTTAVAAAEYGFAASRNRRSLVSDLRHWVSLLTRRLEAQVCQWRNKEQTRLPCLWLRWTCLQFSHSAAWMITWHLAIKSGFPSDLSATMISIHFLFISIVPVDSKKFPFLQLLPL